MGKLLTIEELYMNEILNKNDWEKISKRKLNESIIKEFQDKLNWSYISQFQDEDILEKFINNLYWNNVSKNKKISIDFIKKYKKNINFFDLFESRQCTDIIAQEFFSENKNINKLIFELSTLSEEFIEKNYHIDYIFPICSYQKLSEKLIEKFVPDFDDYVWERIGLSQKLSEDFIRKYQDKLDWYYISGHQKLSEDFIREFKDKVYWKEICTKQQHLSLKFFHEMENDIDWQQLTTYSAYISLSKEFKLEFQDKLKI